MLSEFILIQAIGFLGYALYSASSFAKDKRQNLIMEVATLSIIVVHWDLLDEMIFVFCNLIWMYFSLAGIVKDKYKGLGTLMLLSCVPLILLSSLSQWKGSLIDYTILIGMYVTLASRYFTDEFNFRTVCIIASLFALFNVSWTASVPSVVFSVVFLVGHLRAGYKLLPESFVFYKRDVTVAAE